MAVTTVTQDAGPWTGYSITATVLCTLLMVLLLIGATAAYVLAPDADDSSWGDDRRLYRVVSGVLAVAFLGVAVSYWWGMYPWRAEYHQWRPVSGTVEQVDSRLLPAGSGMEQKFVVLFRGSPQQYGVRDTRAAGVQAGDHLSITCVKRWQWSGTHGYDCNFVSLTRGGSR